MKYRIIKKLGFYHPQRCILGLWIPVYQVWMVGYDSYEYTTSYNTCEEAREYLRKLMREKRLKRNNAWWRRALRSLSAPSRTVSEIKE